MLPGGAGTVLAKMSHVAHVALIGIGNCHGIEYPTGMGTFSKEQHYGRLESEYIWGIMASHVL